MTAKQKANRERFKKVVAEAKKLRAKNPKLTQAQAVKQAWAIFKKTGKVGYSSDRLQVVKTASKYIKKYKEKGYSRKEAIRNANIDSAYISCTKQKQTKVKAKKGKKTSEMHTDTKSHNVNIRVVSGIGNIGENFTRVNNDVNGNPRYVIHFLELLNDEERITIPWTKKYEYAIKKAKKIGGRKFDNKSYGGGIVFQSYNLADTWQKIQKLKNSNIKIKI